jgi:hypothetical protein
MSRASTAVLVGFPLQASGSRCVPEARPWSDGIAVVLTPQMTGRAALFAGVGWSGRMALR